MSLDLQVVRQQLQSCIAQRDQAAQTFQQCVGAIAVLEEQLKLMLAEDMKRTAEEAQKQKEAKEKEDGEVKQQEQVEAPKE